MRLNLALKELQKRLISANKEYYSQCVTTQTVANQRPYALPSDFMQVIRLERLPTNATNGYPTFKLDAITPNERDLYVEGTGAPSAYYFEKNNLMLVPTPDAVYDLHLEYSYIVSDMSADGDTPDAPEIFHEYIAILATRDCLIKDGRPIDPIQAKLGHFEMLLKQISVQRQADGPRMVVTAGNGLDGNWV